MFIIGSPNDGQLSIEELVDEFKNDLEEGTTYSNERDVDVDGLTGLALDVAGDVEGEEVAGRVVYAVDDAHNLMITGFAPKDAWKDG